MAGLTRFAGISETVRVDGGQAMSGIRAMVTPEQRLRLQEGPIDLIIAAESPEKGARERAYRAAAHRFRGLLRELVDELPLLRRQTGDGAPGPKGPVARRMSGAVEPHGLHNFVTPMAAVAGSVADEILAVMTSVAHLDRAYVNNGGDIAFHLGVGQRFRIAIRDLQGTEHGRIVVDHGSRARGIATSGQGGRSHSLGIADSVTVIADSAATADVAATLVANAVDLPDHPAVRRQPARELSPDSDLGDRLVVVGIDELQHDEIDSALEHGRAAAEDMLSAGLIESAALLLRGATRIVGRPGGIPGTEDGMECHV